MFAIASFGRRLRQSRIRRYPRRNTPAIADPANLRVAVDDAANMFPAGVGDRSRPAPARMEEPSPAIPPSRIPTDRPQVGIHLYLLSVALVAAAIIGILLGMGSYLLVRPETETAAGYADEGTGTKHPVPGSSVDEAPPSTTGDAPPRDEVPAPRSTVSEATVPALEVVIMPVLPGATDGDLSQSAQPAPTAEPLDRPAAGKEPPAASVAPTSSEPASSAIIWGVVTDAPNVATWVIVDRTIRLWGIEPRSSGMVASLVNWVRAKGPVECVPFAKTGRYQCLTATGEDIAEAALLAGLARVGERAPTAYRSAEAQARRKGKGLWGAR
jgi:hypothetical protein